MKAQANPAAVLDQAAEAYFGAVRQGVKFQEEVAQRCVELFRHRDTPAMPLAWQQFLKELGPLAQKQAEENFRLLEKNTQQSLGLLRDVLGDGPKSRLEKLWSQSLTNARENTEKLIEANARFVQSWTAMAQNQFAPRGRKPTDR